MTPPFLLLTPQAHCRDTVEGWLELETLTETDEPLADALQELWSEVLAAQDEGEEVKAQLTISLNLLQLPLFST